MERWQETATALADGIRRRELAAAEVVRAHLARIDEVNPGINAIVTLDPEGALDAAAAADRRLARGEAVGPLHGLPIAVKDLEDTAGMRTTYGSPIYRDHVRTPTRCWCNGCGGPGDRDRQGEHAGVRGRLADVFNPVFGATRNPFDRARTAGGSSGGSAAAVASGMMPLADASDLGGSIRNPAAFCGLVGLRPSAGRIPVVPWDSLWSPLGVRGPIARTVEDAALLLRALCGPGSSVRMRAPRTAPSARRLTAGDSGRSGGSAARAGSDKADAWPMEQAGML